MPFEGAGLPAYFKRADTDGPAPTVIMWNGLDSAKGHMYASGFDHEPAERGYYAPRAAAFEKRLALCVAWGASHDWGAVQKRRLERAGENPVPHHWDHVLWVCGETDLDTFIKKAEAVNLDGVVEQITVPFLIAHGENDRQIPLDYAHRSYRQAVNSPKRELRVFTAAEGGAEHVGLDHVSYVSTSIADWIAGESSS